MEEKIRTITVEMTKAADWMEFFKSTRTWIPGSLWEGCFIRYIGAEGDSRAYVQMIMDLDRSFAEKKRNVVYYRTQGFAMMSSQEEILRGTELYEEWKKSSLFPLSFSTGLMQQTASRALKRVIEFFLEGNRKASESIQKNFTIKLLSWSDFYLPKLYPWKGEEIFPKMVFIGDIKQHEYLFCYFLYLIGCDVLYLNPKGDMERSNPKWQTISRLVNGATTLPSIPDLPVFIERELMGNRGVMGNDKLDSSGIQTGKGVTSPTSVPPKEGSIRIQIAPRPGRSSGGQGRDSEPSSTSMAKGGTSAAKSAAPGAAGTILQSPIVSPSTFPSGNRKQELSYEELAQRARSVVMLKVYDEHEECFKTGSGVIINSKGYLLTNYHVITGGTAFGIQFENESKEHITTDIIKCHSFNDLAVLRVDVQGVALPLYEGEDVIRGKQVVAIGSPLGLLNTVSNGIVSGFRTIGEVSMIQFTAPTSHGSSGGALLDMQGKMIGIITCGFDDGQNLNLAVDYKTIYPFIKGFL